MGKLFEHGLIGLIAVKGAQFTDFITYTYLNGNQGLPNYSYQNNIVRSWVQLVYVLSRVRYLSTYMPIHNLALRFFMVTCSLSVYSGEPQ